MPDTDSWSTAWRNLHPRCVACSGSLDVAADAFRCPTCSATYPVVAGVPRFVKSEAYAASFGYEWGRHRKTQLDSVSGLSRSRDAFLAKTGLTADELVGARVLDVGVGSGRFAEIAADLGASVVGIDLTRAADVAGENLGRRALVAQADLFDPPFADETFDVVYSIGVLHHTPDTRAAVQRISRLVKPGGTLAIWVYHPRLSQHVSDAYRRLTTRMSEPALYRLSQGASFLYYPQRIPLVGRLLRGAVPISFEADRAWRTLDTFDWYSPKFQWKHTVPEVVGWFEQLGYSDVRSLTVPTSVRGRKPSH
jgi:SAM-dependent methyltransferase